MKYFRYHNTNCFFIEGNSGRYLSFDAGWPCTFYEYKRKIKDINVKYEDIKWAVISHMHMDHAGLLGEFIDTGIECFVTDKQFEEIDEMERIITKSKEYKFYKKIVKDRLKIIEIGELNEILKINKVEGEIIKTNGHSPDSISLITKSGEALIGDLPPINQIMEYDKNSNESWKLIKSKNAHVIFPSHGEIFRI